MNAYRLTALLTGATITVVQPFYGMSSAVLATVSIRDTAKDVTVFIQGVNSPDSFGSGVIIAKTSKGYTVLTAAHVVSGIDGFTVKTKDGVQHAVKSTQRLSGLDLALVQFESGSTYAIARIGNSDSVGETDTVFVAGYPKPGRNIPVPLFTITDGRVASVIPANDTSDGYGLSYGNPTRAGMSGGPVFNEAGEVIAIHGRKEGETDGSATNGAWVNLGIPINRFKNASTGGVKIAKNTKNTSNSDDQQAKAQAEGEAQRKAQQEAQAEAKRKTELEAQQKAQAESQRKAELEAQQKVQAETQQKAQAEAQLKAKNEAQQKAQAEAQKQAQKQAQEQAQKQAELKTQQQNQAKSRENLIATINPLNVAPSKQQTINAPSYRQVCEDIRINTIVSKRCHSEAVPPSQGSESARPAASSSSPEAYVSRGNVNADGGRYEKAVEDYTTAIGRNSSLATAFFNRGLARYKLGQKDSAIADFSKAADLFKSQGETALYQKTQSILQALTQANS
jgi:Trypsin-like peptidase domain/TPR repeat